MIWGGREEVMNDRSGEQSCLRDSTFQGASQWGLGGFSRPGEECVCLLGASGYRQGSVMVKHLTF